MAPSGFIPAWPRRLAVLAIVASAVALLCARAVPAAGEGAPRGRVTQQRILAAEAKPTQWLTHYGDWRNRQHSGLDQITPATVGRLSLAWWMDMDTDRGVEATPIVVDGTMYVTGSWSILYRDRREDRAAAVDL